MSNQQVAVTSDTRSVLNDMAERFGMRPEPFEATVRAICMPSRQNQREATREEFTAFLLVAKHYNMNPLLKEIYAFPAKGGGIIPIVSVDGWFHLINDHPQMDGIEFAYNDDAAGNLISCTCTIYRKDRTRPIVVTEFYDECKRSTEPWQMKRRMLRHKAAIQCGRYAFGFGGIYDDDEGEKIAMRDITPAPDAPAAPEAPTAPDAPAARQEPARVVEGEIIPPADKNKDQPDERQEASAPKTRGKQQAKPADENATTKRKEEPAKPKEEAKVETTAPNPPAEETDPAKMGFDAYLPYLEKQMRSGSEADAAEFWKNRRREFTNDQQSAMIDMRGRVRQYFDDLENNPAQQDDDGQTQGFDPVAFKDATKQAIADAQSGQTIMDLKDKCDSLIERGIITQEQFDSWFDEDMMIAMERLPD